MELEQQIGYLVAKMEELTADVKTLSSSHEELKERVNDKFKIAETLFKLFKFVGIAVVTVLSFKFGDLPNIWHNFFK